MENLRFATKTEDSKCGDLDPSWSSQLSAQAGARLLKNKDGKNVVGVVARTDLIPGCETWLEPCDACQPIRRLREGGLVEMHPRIWEKCLGHRRVRTFVVCVVLFVGTSVCRCVAGPRSIQGPGLSLEQRVSFSGRGRRQNR